MIGGGLSNEVVQYIEEWIPERKYRTEKKFQNDLQDYLDQRLNESEGTGMGVGLGGGGGENVPVRKEYGQSNADVAVDDEIGIELKRDLTNSNVDRLVGQIRKYRKEFPVVIVVACGIEDIGRWRELQNDYDSGMEIGMNQSEVHFIHKKKEHFGKDPSELNRDGGDDPFGGMF